MVVTKPISNIEEIIFNVLWPFEHTIFKRRHNIHLITKLEPNISMETDWSLYELILFNLVQNAVKYNKSYDGDVVIAIKCKPLKKRLEEHHLDSALNAVLETIVIDTGVGIEEDR